MFIYAPPLLRPALGRLHCGQDDGETTMSTAQARFDDMLTRADEVLAKRLKREAEALEREDAEREEARRARARANAEERTEIASRFDSQFRSFGVEVPMPVDDEAPSRYRARLFNRLARKLPTGHDYADLRADDFGSAVALDHFEIELLKAATVEGLTPSPENLPSDGSLVARHRTDDMGAKVTEFYGKRSFIADMGRPGRRVAKIVDPRSGAVIWGRNFDTVR
jgi:hypothetical protein